MKDMTRLIVGGLTLVGIAVAGYRTYEIRKLQKAIKEEEIIEIEPEVVSSTQK